ncbi:hypothetical protein NADFUDRAFT_82052 [Nadsonia fulvescens var. elongata DSM 6958]|uniref:Uncharacterized protein n=1 Tax=Nadsonia fulvescens var. elongata DSM 6958 TaxID=857566 RepID=A0A1E3PQB3_9ASCO|nr:hypothetical protein NADFUDRAFT_82052 [Nadsonia fulvescens var. elongata DSM 6958]
MVSNSGANFVNNNRNSSIPTKASSRTSSMTSASSLDSRNGTGGTRTRSILTYNEFGRAQSLTTTTIHKMGAFEVIKTTTTPIDDLHLPTHTGSRGSFTGSHYESSIFSHEGNLNPVAEEEVFFEDDLDHRPFLGMDFPLKSIQNSSERSKATEGDLVNSQIDKSLQPSMERSVPKTILEVSDDEENNNIILPFSERESFHKPHISREGFNENGNGSILVSLDSNNTPESISDPQHKSDEPAETSINEDNNLLSPASLKSSLKVSSLDSSKPRQSVSFDNLTDEVLGVKNESTEENNLNHVSDTRDADDSRSIVNNLAQFASASAFGKPSTDSMSVSTHLPKVAISPVMAASAAVKKNGFHSSSTDTNLSSLSNGNAFEGRNEGSSHISDDSDDESSQEQILQQQKQRKLLFQKQELEHKQLLIKKQQEKLEYQTRKLEQDQLQLQQEQEDLAQKQHQGFLHKEKLRKDRLQREKMEREKLQREQQLKERKLKELKLREQRLREQQLREQQLREQQLKERRLREQRQKEQQREQRLKKENRERLQKERLRREELKEQRLNFEKDKMSLNGQKSGIDIPNSQSSHPQSNSKFPSGSLREATSTSVQASNSPPVSQKDFASFTTDASLSDSGNVDFENDAASLNSDSSFIKTRISVVPAPRLVNSSTYNPSLSKSKYRTYSLQATYSNFASPPSVSNRKEGSSFSMTSAASAAKINSDDTRRNTLANTGEYNLKALRDDIYSNNNSPGKLQRSLSNSSFEKSKKSKENKNKHFGFKNMSLRSNNKPLKREVAQHKEPILKQQVSDNSSSQSQQQELLQHSGEYRDSFSLFSSHSRAEALPSTDIPFQSRFADSDSDEDDNHTYGVNRSKISTNKETELSLGPHYHESEKDTSFNGTLKEDRRLSGLIASNNTEAPDSNGIMSLTNSNSKVVKAPAGPTTGTQSSIMDSTKRLFSSKKTLRQRQELEKQNTQLRIQEEDEDKPLQQSQEKQQPQQKEKTQQKQSQGRTRMSQRMHTRPAMSPITEKLEFVNQKDVGVLANSGKENDKLSFGEKLKRVFGKK